MKILREIINLPISLIFLLINIIILLKPSNIIKIIKYKNIVLHRSGGFGNQIFANDIIRYSKEKFLYILFFDPTRFNQYTSFVFNVQHIYFPTCIGKRLSFKNRVGEYEGSKVFPSYVFFNILLRIFFKNVFDLNSFYKNFLNENKKDLKKINFRRNNFKIFKKHMDLYFYKIKNSKKKKPLLPIDILKKVEDKLILKSINLNKVCTIYLRSKSINSVDASNVSRNGSSKKEYIRSFKYLVKKNFTIFLVGDDIFSQKEIIKFKKKIIDYKFAGEEKDLFQIYALTSNHAFISEPGGAQFFALYSKKSIGINYFPIGYKPPFDFIKYKTVINNKKKPISQKNKIKINFDYDIAKYSYKIISNKSEEIFSSIKKIF